MTATPDGALDYVNRRGTDYFGVPEASLLGTGWLSLIHPDDRNRTVERWKESLVSGKDYEFLFRLRRGSDQSWRWHLVRAMPFLEENGFVSQWFGTCTDIEDQKAAETELVRANRELEEFAYVASHDLQEPLRMVNIYTQLLIQRFSGDEPEAEKFAGFVKQGVNRMETLIRDLLIFSRTVHKEERTVGAASLSIALADALSVLKDRIERSHTQITCSELPVVRGDIATRARLPECSFKRD